MMTSSEPPAPCARPAISPTAPTASAVDRPGVGPAVPVGGGDDVLEVRDAGVDGPDGAARVGDQGRPVHAAPAGQLRGDLVGVGERGHGLRGDEGRRLDPADAGGDERLEHLQLGVQRDRGLQLQAVAHPDLADVDRRRQHQVELVHARLLGRRLSVVCPHPAPRRAVPRSGRPGTVP